MVDEQTHKSFLEGARININDKENVAFWAKRLGVSTERLLEVMLKVGSSVPTVQKALGAT